jgi:hypothetical protein
MTAAPHVGASEAAPSVRWATLADDPALLALARSVSMGGPVRYRLEREPSFFPLLDLQGSANRVVVAEQPGAAAPVGMLAAAARRAFWRGQPERLSYVCDAKVRADAQGQGLFGHMAHLLLPTLRTLGDALFCLVLAGNPAFPRLDRHASLGLTFHRVARIRNYSLFYGSKHAVPSGLRVRAARAGDAPLLEALWNERQASRNLATVIEPNWFTQCLTRAPGVCLEDFRVVERVSGAGAGEVIAFGLPWDLGPLKQVRLLGLSPGLRVVRRLLNPVLPLAKRAKITADGELLPFKYLAFACAADAAGLRALIASVLNEGRASKYLYLDLALDVRDPLTGALAGFLRTSLDFDLFLATWAGSNLDPNPGGRLAHFEMALV